MIKTRKILFSIFMLFILVGCTTNTTVVEKPLFEFTTKTNTTLEMGETLQLEVNDEFLESNKIEDISFTYTNDCINISKSGLVTAIKPGTVTIVGNYETTYDEIDIIVTEPSVINVYLSTDFDEVYVGDTVLLNGSVKPSFYMDDIEYVVTSGRDCVRIDGNLIQTIKDGKFTVIAKVNEYVSEEIEITVLSKDITSDPYENVNVTEFYANYIPATSYMDAYYRTLHGLMSGSIEPQQDVPTVADYQPMKDGKYVKNTSALYSADGNTYYILDGYGNVTNQIYKGAAYVSLEEVAAYVLAFNDIPVNYSSSKKTKPSSSIWGKYLRVNHTQFSGDTSRYPYEPELPNISGCGGDYKYYEIDLGTTGTDTGNGYKVAEYNDGNTITRGAARIVYSRFDRNGNDIIEFDEKYVFYTYNHYNDFQEYLNYEGGWGEMFGNITGGGTLSSKYNYNPTPYVEVSLEDISNSTYSLILTINQQLDQLIVYYNKEYQY